MIGWLGGEDAVAAGYLLCLFLLYRYCGEGLVRFDGDIDVFHGEHGFADMGEYSMVGKGDDVIAIDGTEGEIVW